MKTFWEIKNATKQSADIYLYDEIGKSYWGESTSAKDFKKELDNIGNVKNLNIYINSPGGSVFDGVAIYNQLKRTKAYKTVYIDGLAASIASVIALAGDKVVIAKNGYFMIHRAWTVAWGNTNDFAKVAEDLQKIDEGIIKTYEDRSALLRDEIVEMMDEETWMTGEEALECGFADELGDQIEVAASAAGSDIWTKFKKVPEGLSEEMQEPGVRVDSSFVVKSEIDAESIAQSIAEKLKAQGVLGEPKGDNTEKVTNGRVPVEIINQVYERSIKHA